MAKGEGGDSGNSSQLWRRCGKTTPFGCPGRERRGEARGAPRQGYLCGNIRQPPACWESFSGKGDAIAKRQRQRQWGGLRRRLRGFNAGRSGDWFRGGGIACQMIAAAPGQKGAMRMATATATTHLFFAVDPSTWRGANARVCAGRTLPPSLPIAQAHVARSLRGGGTKPLVTTMSTMRPGTDDVATASAPGGG